jgi:hypothetical protein
MLYQLLPAASRTKDKLHQFLALIGLNILLLANAHSQLVPPDANYKDVKARYSTSASGSLHRLEFEPLALRGGSTLVLSSPRNWESLALKVRSRLLKTHERFSALFGDIPQFATTLRLMDEQTFFATTGAPSWTNAIYFQNQIFVPLAPGAENDFDNIMRAVEHEYTHAVIHALSSGRCPGWFDEGLAQWAEGSENPALLPALNDWLKKNDPVPFRLLQGGFTKLDAKMIPAAYAQSLYATKAVIEGLGFVQIRNYLDRLRAGETKAAAFLNAFGLEERDFEIRLAAGLGRWGERKHFHKESDVHK